MVKNKLPLEVWIDDGLPRRIAYSVRGPASGGSVEVESSTDIFDYGEPLTVDRHATVHSTRPRATYTYRGPGQSWLSPDEPVAEYLRERSR